MATFESNGLLAGYDLKALRDKVQRPPFDAVYARLRQAVYEAAEADARADRIAFGGWCHSLYFTPKVMEAALVARLGDDATAARHVERQIDKLARVYADPPASFYREFGELKGKPSAYFSNAHTCLAARMCRPQLTPATYDRIVQLARERLIDDCHRPEYFFTHFNAGHNAVVTHVISAAICALVFGAESGHPETERLIALGRDACEAHLHWGFDEAGVPHEGPMYALVTLDWVFLYAELLRQHGRGDLFRELPGLATVAEAAGALQLPGNVGIVGFNDCRNLITQRPMPWLLLTTRQYQRPQDLALWWHTVLLSRQDKELPGPDRQHARRPDEWIALLELLWWDGVVPATEPAVAGRPTAFVGRGKALAQFRSSWRSEATCVTVLGQGRSHNCPDHTHADAGHFCIYSHGDYIAYDTAYFNFDEDTHSVILIDGRPFAPATKGNQYAGRFSDVQHCSLLDYVCVEAAAAKGCIWALRHVLFVRGAGDDCYLVVLDNINRDNGVHQFDWQLQGNLHTAVEVTGERSAVVRGRTARLDCHFFNPEPDDFPGVSHRLEVLADHHQHWQIMTREPETNPRLIARQTGCNCTLAAVIVPRALTAEPFTVNARPAYRTFEIGVQHGAFTDRIVFACDHIHVRLPGLRAASEILLVRCDAAGNHVGTWAVDGKPVSICSPPK